jgi:hypothetical protein
MRPRQITRQISSTGRRLRAVKPDQIKTRGNEAAVEARRSGRAEAPQGWMRSYVLAVIVSTEHARLHVFLTAGNLPLPIPRPIARVSPLHLSILLRTADCLRGRTDGGTDRGILQHSLKDYREPRTRLAGSDHGTRARFPQPWSSARGSGIALETLVFRVRLTEFAKR